MDATQNRYRSVKIGSRGGTFYHEDIENGIHKSLGARDARVPITPSLHRVKTLTKPASESFAEASLTSFNPDI